MCVCGGVLGGVGAAVPSLGEAPGGPTRNGAQVRGAQIYKLLLCCLILHMNSLFGDHYVFLDIQSVQSLHNHNISFNLDYLLN